MQVLIADDSEFDLLLIFLSDPIIVYAVIVIISINFLPNFFSFPIESYIKGDFLNVPPPKKMP